MRCARAPNEGYEPGLRPSQSTAGGKLPKSAEHAMAIQFAGLDYALAALAFLNAISLAASRYASAPLDPGS